MSARRTREAVRRIHRPAVPGGYHCDSCGEPAPCAAIQFLGELERVEDVARAMQDRANFLQRHVEDLEGRISRAVRELEGGNHGSHR